MIMSTRLSHLAGALATALLLSGTASLAAPQAPGDVPTIKYEVYALQNGLRVIIAEDHRLPLVAVNLWYHVGPAYEEPGRTGFAHLFEHMMFQGSKHVPANAHIGMLEAAGASDLNGTTDFDRTNYFETVPSHQLELAIWLEADRMGTLTETLTKQKLDNQREVVKNERRQSFDNQPYGSWLEKALAYVYPESHPYHHSVIGSMTDLTNASVEDVTSFFKTYYAPNNAVLVIAGDLDLAEAKALVRKRFSWIPRGPAVPTRPSMTIGPVIGTEHREVVQDANASAPAIYVAYRVPPARATDGPAVDLLGDIMAGSTASPLYRTLVRDKQIAVAVQSFNIGLVDGADMLVFVALGKPGTNADSLEKALMTELDKGGTLVTQALLDRSRAGSRYQVVNGLQSTGGFGGRADQLAEGFTYYRDPNHVNNILARYDAVTVAQLKRLAASRLIPTNRVRLVFVPKPKAAPAAGGTN